MPIGLSLCRFSHAYSRVYSARVQPYVLGVFGAIQFMYFCSVCSLAHRIGGLLHCRICLQWTVLANFAGKTFTMEGVDDPSKPELRGIMLNVFDFIFDQIQDDDEHQREYLVYISYLEIYNEEIRDLLSKDSDKLQLKEAADKGVYVKGLKKVWYMAVSARRLCVGM